MSDRQQTDRQTDNATEKCAEIGIIVCTARVIPRNKQQKKPEDIVVELAKVELVRRLKNLKSYFSCVLKQWWMFADLDKMHQHVVLV